MLSTDYLEEKILLLENEISSLANTMERLDVAEKQYKRMESLLTFIVGYLLAPDKPAKNLPYAKEACSKMILAAR
jgi:hypothetical protein